MPISSKRSLQETQDQVPSLNNNAATSGPVPSTSQPSPFTLDEFGVEVPSYKVHVHSRPTRTAAKPVPKERKASDGTQVKIETKSGELLLSPMREDIIKTLIEFHSLDIAEYDIIDRGPPFQFSCNKATSS